MPVLVKNIHIHISLFRNLLLQCLHKCNMQNTSCLSFWQLDAITAIKPILELISSLLSSLLSSSLIDLFSFPFFDRQTMTINQPIYDKRLFTAFKIPNYQFMLIVEWFFYNILFQWLEKIISLSKTICLAMFSEPSPFYLFMSIVNWIVFEFLAIMSSCNFEFWLGVTECDTSFLNPYFIYMFSWTLF